MIRFYVRVAILVDAVVELAEVIRRDILHIKHGCIWHIGF